MSKSDFVHLHLHSQYSLLDGANRLDDVIGTAVSMGMPAVALTDHGNMFGAIEFYTRCKAAGIKPLVGVEAYVAQGSRLERIPGRGSNNHLVLLAKNETGYRNLLKLTSSAYLEGFYYKPRIDKGLLRQHSEGLIGLSACLKGEINEKIVGNLEKEAEATARDFLEIFGDGNFYLEMQDHGIPEQRLANEVLRRISRRTGIPLVVSNDCHYHKKDDAFAHDILLCIGTQKMASDPDRMKYHSDNFYMKSADEIHSIFPEDHAAIENTLAIAEACDLVIPMEGFQLPEYSVPDGYSLSSYFEQVAREGLEQRLALLRARNAKRLQKNPEERYRERLEYEIQVIEKMGFAGYFLVVWDFIRYAKEHAIPVGPGRGSAAGSVVSWALKITDIDPLQYDLLFERFLNPDRISMPDIDIDIQDTRRDEVIKYCADKYGSERVANIVTFGKMAARAAVRDVARVLQVPYGDADRLAKMIPAPIQGRHIPLKISIEKDPDLKKEYETNPTSKRVIDFAIRLEGTIRS
ncbi:MAG TPA: DNA polymerase III subunit alpha, partial [Thermoanaerobaculia bacterium]